MKLTEIGVNNYRSKEILTEGWQQLTESQQVYIGRWETTVWPLVESYSKLLEQNLDSRSIQKIFTSAEQVLNAQGKNTTALGRAGKVTSQLSLKIKQEIERLAKASQQTQPIKNIDKQFDQLKLKIKNELGSSPIGRKLLTTVDGWKQFSEENPGKSAFVLGAMTSVLAFASGGIVSGAAIGLFIRLANNVIKGDDLSTAVGNSSKGAAIGAAAGLVGDMFQSDNVEIPTSTDDVSTDTVRVMTNDGFKDLNREEILQGKQDGSIKRSIANKMLRKLEMQADAAESMEEQIWSALDVYELNEAPAALGAIGKLANRAADAISKVAQKGADKAATGAKAVGKELGSQVTVRKLTRMWKNSGSPTDLESVINILKSAGLSDEQIGTVSKQARIDLTAQQPQTDQVDIQSLAKQITDLGLADEVKLILNPKGPEDRQPEFKSNRNQPTFKSQRQKPAQFKSTRPQQSPTFKSQRT